MDDEVEFEPDFSAIAEALQTSPVYIDPSVSDAVTEADLAALSGDLQARDEVFHVIVIPLEIGSSWSEAQVATLVHRELQDPGQYVVSRVSYDGRWDLTVVPSGVSEDRQLWYASNAAGNIYPGDLGQQLLELFALYDAGEAEAVWDAQMETSGVRQPSSTEEDGALPVPIDGWVVGALGMAALITAVVVWRRRLRRQGRLTLTKRTLGRISAAQSESWRRRADEALARLGEEIGRHEISAEADRAAWTAALDHYDVASAALARSADAADSLGAIVVAERGLDALEAALDHRTWQPTRGCFFNPLHEAASTEVAWETEAGSIKAPACGACAQDMKRGREPEFLNLPYREAVVHYTDAHAEPWSSTGFGALDEDLVEAWRHHR